MVTVMFPLSAFINNISENLKIDEVLWSLLTPTGANCTQSRCDDSRNSERLLYFEQYQLRQVVTSKSPVPQTQEFGVCWFACIIIAKLKLSSSTEIWTSISWTWIDWQPIFYIYYYIFGRRTVYFLCELKVISQTCDWCLSRRFFQRSLG